MTIKRRIESENSILKHLPLIIETIMMIQLKRNIYCEIM